MKNIKDIMIIVLVLITSALFLYISTQKEEKKASTPVEIRCDTVFSHSTDTIYIREIEYKEIKVVDTLHIRDTVLLYEKKHYQDSISSIWISGYNPTIESITYTLPRDTTFIFKETQIEKKDSFWKNRFIVSLNVSAGYGLITRKPDVFVGIGVGIRLY